MTKERYLVVCDPNMAVFTNKVNDAIRDGWSPTGGISVCLNAAGEPWLFQALWK